jgi:sulfur carrier protein
MKLQINGKQEEVTGEVTVHELLIEKDVESPDMVSVELNGIILSRSDFTQVRVKENDAIEILYFMGGGSAV